MTTTHALAACGVFIVSVCALIFASALVLSSRCSREEEAADPRFREDYDDAMFI